MFDLAAFERMTPQCRGRLRYERVMQSTSDEAKREILAGCAESGSIYLAEYQTGGRGRGDHRWVCPEGEGLLFSIVVEPDVEPMLWYRMSLAAGLAIVDSIRELGVDAEMKWPNDIYVNDKKLGGVLIEQVDGLLVVGVGLNVDVKTFTEEVEKRGTSISNHLAENAEVNREALLSSVVHAIYRNGSMIGDGFEYLVDQAMSCFYLKGKKVKMLVNGSSLEGRVLGMSKDGYLQLKESNEIGGIIDVHQAQEIKTIN